MTQAKLRLLLLSVGTLEAHNVIDALGPRRERCVLIGTNSIPEAAGNFRCDIVYLVPPTASGAGYIERVTELIREEGADLVIPCRDDDVLALAVLGEQSPHAHPALLTGTVAAARIWKDKVETARFARRHGLPFVPTAENVREALEFAKIYRLPLIGKPRSGSGSRGVVLLRSAEEIERAFESRSDLIAQPFLDPPSNMDALVAPFEAGLPLFFSFPEACQYIATALVGPDGAISSLFGWLCTLVGGQVIEIRRCDDPELLETGRAYALAAAAEGWKGPLNVQLKRTREGGLVVHELNGRFGGATAARIDFGCDEVGEAVRRFLPGAAFPSIAPYEAHVVQRYHRAYPVSREGVIALRTFGRWSSGIGNTPPKSEAPRTEAKLRLLLLSVGSLAGQNVIDALGARRERCVLIGTNSIPESAGNFRCDTVYRVPPAASGTAYIERIAELIRAEQPDLVIPCRDDDVLALAMLGEQALCANAVLVTGTVAAARVMNDKVQTARFAGRHRLSFAPTAENAREALELAKTHRLPLIGKPRSGYASHGVVLLRSIEEIERAFKSRSDLIAQPFLDPPSNMDALIAPFDAGLPLFFSFPATHYSVQVIVGPDAAISNPFTALSTQVGGQGSEIKRLDDPELVEISRAFAVAAAVEGWKGPLNLQFKRTPGGKLVAFELNGRFGGGTAARALMGFDEIGEVVSRFLPAAAFPLISASESDIVQRYLHGYSVRSEGLDALRKSGRWSRASAA